MKIRIIKGADILSTSFKFLYYDRRPAIFFYQLGPRFGSVKVSVPTHESAEKIKLNQVQIVHSTHISTMCMLHFCNDIFKQAWDRDDHLYLFLRKT